MLSSVFSYAEMKIHGMYSDCYPSDNASLGNFCKGQIFDKFANVCEINSNKLCKDADKESEFL